MNRSKTNTGTKDVAAPSTKFGSVMMEVPNVAEADRIVAAAPPPAEPTAPIGSVVAFAGPVSAIPVNWLVCDGRKMSPGTDFPTLFARIGTTWGGDGVNDYYLPDLRAQFLRGVDKGQEGNPSGRDPGRDRRAAFAPPPNPSNPGNSGNSVGSFQESATAMPKSSPFATSDSGDHRHGDPTWNGQGGPYELAVQFRGPGDFDYGPQSAPTTPAGNHSHTVVNGGDAETRPINAYVYWIIRAK